MSPAMHSFVLGGERVRDAKITTQAFSHLYGFKDQAIPETNLPSCIAQVIAVPTSPGVAGVVQTAAAPFSGNGIRRTVSIR